MNEETNGKFLIHDTIISWACIIWAVASFGLIIYFTGLKQVTFSIMTFGQLFLIMGIICLRKGNISGILFTLTGIGCIVIPALNEWGPLANTNIQINYLIPIFIPVAITLVGLAMMVVPGLLENMAEIRCKVIVKAEYVDFKSVELNDGTTAYSPVYAYTYKDKQYVKERNKYSRKKIGEIGEVVELKINEKNPLDVYFEASKASKMLIYIFGMCFFVTGVGMLLTVLGNLR